MVNVLQAEAILSTSNIFMSSTTEKKALGQGFKVFFTYGSLYPVLPAIPPSPNKALAIWHRLCVALRVSLPGWKLSRCYDGEKCLVYIRFDDKWAPEN